MKNVNNKFKQTFIWWVYNRNLSNIFKWANIKNLNKRKIEKPHRWDLGLGACWVITWLKRGWIGRLVKMEQWSFSMRSQMAWPVPWVLHGIIGVFLVHWEIWWWTNWAFLELILQQLGLIPVDLWAMILGFWPFLWNKPFCQFWAQFYCMYLDSLVQWTVSFKLGPYFTKFHGWTIRFGALIQRIPKS